MAGLFLLAERNQSRARSPGHISRVPSGAPTWLGKDPSRDSVELDKQEPLPSRVSVVLWGVFKAQLPFWVQVFAEPIFILTKL